MSTAQNTKQQDPYRIEIVIEGLPKTTNSLGRSHWTVKAAEAKSWINRVFVAIGSNRPRTPLTKAKLCLVRCSSAEPDFDGLVSSFKHCVDGLIHAQVIVSDKPSVIGQPEYRWEKAPPKSGFVRVIVEEA